jgi:hypothetical protein
MSDDIQTLKLDAQRRLKHSFRQLQVMVLQERLAALIGGETTDSGVQPIPPDETPDPAPSR